MRRGPVGPWRRLLYAFAAMSVTLLLTLAAFTIADFSREPNLEWFNGGEIEVVGYLSLYGGIVIGATYILFVAPLVLLWPLESQRRHWYAMLGVSMLWSPLFLASDRTLTLSGLLWDIHHDFELYGALELFALCSCGCYLLLIVASTRP